MAARRQAAISHKSAEETISVPKLEQTSRPTTELVIGFVGAVGAGVSKTCEVVKALLEEQYDYEVEIVKASSVIRENSGKCSNNKVASTGSDRIKDLQRVGTELRERFGQDYVALKIIEKIATHRKSSSGYDETTEVPQPVARRRATIIDSLKHPKESLLLREVYGGLYWQFTVFAPEEIRETRLNSLGIEKSSLLGIFTRDEDDSEGDHGQKVSKTAYLSDFFVRNDGQNDERLTSVVTRFLEIVFNISVHTPTSFEAGMYAAVSAAGKSACLSRQVGAALYSSQGELISVGWNDVPRASGGLYAYEDEKHDHRCFKWEGKQCHNDLKKEDLYKRIHAQLLNSGLLKENTRPSDTRAALTKTPVKQLIEYSRSIHAEMEAIVSAARTGKRGIVGGILYTTTFPCHNCARHIVAAGIAQVYYIEPYAKSLALDLHRDSIGMRDVKPSEIGERRKVAFLQYEGVGPDSMMKLFHHGVERKRDGKANVLDKKSAVPVLPPPMDGFTTHEKRVMIRLERVEGS